MKANFHMPRSRLRRIPGSPIAAMLIACLMTAPLVGLAQTSGGGAPAGPPAASASASAEVKDPKKEEAAVRYARGIELYKEENYKAALVEFKKAYELTGTYKVLFNIGQVCYQLQDYVCAVTSFEGYLSRGGPELGEKRRDEVNAELKKLRPRIAEVTIVTNVPGVDITVDDIPRGKTPLPAIRLSAGSHRLTAIKEGKVAVTQSFDVAGADKPTIKLDLVDTTGKSVVVRERIGDTSKWTTLSFVGLGAGGAMLVAGGVTGVLALRAASDLDNKNYVGEPTDDAKDKRSQVKSLRLATDILIAAGVVTVGTTLVLTLTRKTEAPSTTTTPGPAARRDGDVKVGLGIGPGSFLIHGEF